MPLYDINGKYVGSPKKEEKKPLLESASKILFNNPLINGSSDLTKGVLKGAGSTAFGIGKLAQQILKGATGKDIIPLPEEAPDILKAKNPLQKTGKFIEQVAEFAVPASKLGKATKGASLTTKMASEATLAGGVATAQEGGLGKESVIASVTGGLFPLASKVVSSGLKKIPESAWAGILKRTSKQVIKNPDLPQQASKTGIIGSEENIVKQASNTIQQIEVQLDDILRSSEEKIPTKSVIDRLSSLQEVYSQVPGEGNAIQVIDNLGKDVLSRGEFLTPLQANQIKRDIYKVIEKSYGKGTLEIPAKAEGQKMIARALKEEIEKVSPEIKDLNDNQAIYIQIKKAIERQSALGEGRGAIPIIGNVGLYDILIGTGGGVVGGIPGSIGAVIAKKVGTSPSFLSGLAKFLNYFNEASPTKKLLIYEGLKGVTAKTGTNLSK